MPLNADQLLAVFPHPVLTNIFGEPNLASITLQQSEHNGNLSSIKSNLGDGLTGLMVLSMKTDIFKTIHPDTFVIPTNPGPAPDPVVIAAAFTDTKIVRETNLTSIKLQQHKHNGNLTSIKSNLGDGLTGLMVLSMKPYIFKTIQPDTFVISTNPGPAPEPDVISAASTATKIADIYKAYDL